MYVICFNNLMTLPVLPDYLSACGWLVSVCIYKVIVVFINVSFVLRVFHNSCDPFHIKLPLITSPCWFLIC